MEWTADQPWCEVLRAGKAERVLLRLGKAGETDIEVIEGLRAGEQVRLP